VNHLSTCSTRLRAWALRAVLCAAAFVAPAAGAQTLVAAMNGGLRALDPIVSTTVVTSVHAFMVYDMLLGQDAAGKVQPQMASWQVSPDGKAFTFVLRDGLKWHDGAPVTAEDCIASIRRWAQADVMGQTVMGMVTAIRPVDARTFVVILDRPSDLLLEALSKPSSRQAVMMPRRLAETPPTQPVKENIGSGPFRFVGAEFKPGVRAVYERFKDYVPRKEPASGSAGGKAVHVERVEWVTMPDNLTAVNALLSGEIDFLEFVPYDLLPMLQGRKNVQMAVLNQHGNWNMFRMNFLHPPFNNAKVRRAAMYAVGQEEVLQALVGNPKYYRTCVAVFGCGLPYESSYGQDVIVKPQPEKARQLLKEAGYDGTPVVLLHPSDHPFGSPQPLVIAQQLRNAGFTVQLQTSDWQALTARRGNQNPPAQGGWNLFVTFSAVGDQSDPIRSLLIGAAGRKSWFGWPDVPAIEEARLRFGLAASAAERKKIAEEVQRLVVDEGVLVPLGQFVFPSAWSSKVSGVPQFSRPVFWGVRKAK
jgi:peptide/nickel transport system substrate-binding protein